LHAYRLPAELLPAAAADLETLARLWQRECLLLPVALYLDAHELDRAGPPEHGASAVQRFLSRLHGVCFLDTRDSLPGLDFSLVPIDVVRPTLAEQRAAWGTALANDAADSPDLLASQFNLSLAAIGEIAESVRVES